MMFPAYFLLKKYTLSLVLVATVLMVNSPVVIAQNVRDQLQQLPKSISGDRSLTIGTNSEVRSDGPTSALAQELTRAEESNRIAINKRFLPSEARFIELPKIREQEIVDLIKDIFSELELSRGYKVEPLSLDQFPLPSDQIVLVGKVKRASAEKMDVIYLGYFLRDRFNPRLWIYGASAVGGVSVPNPDANTLNFDSLIKNVFDQTFKYKSSLSLADLTTKVINLSYIDADSALVALRAMGFSVITDEVPLANDDSYKGELKLSPVGNVGGVPPLPGMFMPESARFPINALDASPLAASNNPFGRASAPNFAGLGLPNVAGAAAPGFGNFGSLGMPQNDKATLAIRNLPTSISYSRLPLIVKMPPPTPESMGLVGVSSPNSFTSPGGFGGSVGGFSVGYGANVSSPATSSAAGPLAAPVSGGNTSQIMVLFHPRDIDQFNRVKKAIEETIDRPARQVYVEGIVLEVLESKMSELGVQLSKSGINRGRGQITLGSLGQLNVGAGTPATNYVFESTESLVKSFMLRLNALVESNQAEVLSRPSILTLDNRQAVIRVGADVPVATSTSSPSFSGGGASSYNFNYHQTGILLNIRPRVSQDGQEVSMLIDASISEIVPGADLRMTNADGVTLASAPTIATRKIQTYARIKNNSPLIIGGLVNRDTLKSGSKVPLLGEIPVLGNLFGYDARRKESTEVVIVLMPSIIDEHLHGNSILKPKNDEWLDTKPAKFGSDIYRIRDEDVIDTRFIRENKKFNEYKYKANLLLNHHPGLINAFPFSELSATRVPGEFALVTGMLARTLSRTGLHKSLQPRNVVYFDKKNEFDFHERSLADLFSGASDVGDVEEFFRQNPKKAIALKFLNPHAATSPRAWINRPVPEVSLVDCPDREAWRKLLWELNQPNAQGVQSHYTILIHEHSDLERLRLAILVDKAIARNGNASAMTLANFVPGRSLNLQDISSDTRHVLMPNIARYFFYVEHFYGAFTESFERAMNSLEVELSKPEYAWILDKN